MYEEIMSDEEDIPEYPYTEEWLMEEWEDWLKPFSQDQFHLMEMNHLVSPILTEYQVEHQKWKYRFEMEGPDLEEEPTQVRDDGLILHGYRHRAVILKNLKD